MGHSGPSQRSEVRKGPGSVLDIVNSEAWKVVDIVKFGGLGGLGGLGDREVLVLRVLVSFLQSNLSFLVQNVSIFILSRSCMGQHPIRIVAKSGIDTHELQFEPHVVVLGERPGGPGETVLGMRYFRSKRSEDLQFLLRQVFPGFPARLPWVIYTIRFR